ncbi:P-loop containing nucleoside triphosphate hydrolase protein [Lyophyllum atratum]|nr:P-loop containing nucleoside triphosphate hydrolase protein [Lyophyllum atratum]
MEELIPQWQNGPRDFQVDIWAHILDKIPVLLIAHTGGGKTAAFWGPIRIMQYLLRHPVNTIPKPPSRPVGIIITPLIELGNNHLSSTFQAREISEFGIKAVSVNAETAREATGEGRNLYTEVRECKWPIVLVSPEKLLSSELDGVLRDEDFRSNIVLLGIDEAHVLLILKLLASDNHARATEIAI